MKEQITPIDVGKGIPIVATACALIVGIAAFIIYTAWKSGRYEIQALVLGVFLYIVMILTYRFTETKKELPVPTFKGWETHKADVEKVCKEFQEFLKYRLPGEKASINRFKHGAHESHRTVETAYKKDAFKINLGNLDNVIAIDKDKLLLHAEPGLPMDEMAGIAIAHGFLPQIVPEFPGITVGGAIGGVAGESTGHKYGLFHNTIESMDVITGDGIFHENVSRSHESDLFMAMCGSYGTQGILVRASIRLVLAPKYVRTDYYHMSSMEMALTKMEELANQENPPEFLDGLALSSDSAVVIAGYPTNHAEKVTLSLRANRTDPWFFWYVTDLTRKHSPSEISIHTDILSVDDYLFRFDRGAFWAARHGMMFLFGTSSYNPDPQKEAGPTISLRGLWSWVGTTRQMYKLCHSPGDVKFAETYIIQDFILPTKAAAVELTHFNTKEDYHIWPLWICPIRKVEANHEQEIGLGLPLEGKQGDLMFNLGFYGPVNSGKPMNPIQKNKELEQKVFSLKGKKWLYAQSFYTEEEFWAHYNQSIYELLREKYKNKDIFHPITQKVLLSSKTKDAICSHCQINLLSYFHKVIGTVSLGLVELLTPRFIHPFIGIDHTQTKVYTL
jgi:FAD/FMN-containing dehydrogenase